jgi:hypothetical protein
MLPTVILFAAVWIAVPPVMHGTQSSAGTMAVFLLLPVSCFAAGAVFGLRLGERWIGGTAWRVTVGVLVALSTIEAWQRWERMAAQRRAAARGEHFFRLCAGDCAGPSFLEHAVVVASFAAVAVVLAVGSGAAARLAVRRWRKRRA